MRQALEYPWERWGVFLHPSQRAVVERRFAGPARVSGSAGTGKTVVALHRAVALARKNPQARVLADDVLRAVGPFALRQARGARAGDRRHCAADHRRGLARRGGRAVSAVHGRRPRIVATDMLRTMIAKAADAAGVKGFTQRFLLSEWTNVVDAWGIDGPERYASVPRLGRRSPLGPRQRERLWSVFEPVAAALREQGVFTRCRGLSRGRGALCRARATNRSTISSSTKRRILGPPSFPSSPPSRRPGRTRCFLPAISASGSFSTRFHGKRSASTCEGARQP